MAKRKTILLSHDALVMDDLEYLRTKPCFGELLRRGALVELRSVYPTVTYPQHASLITGCYPECTGIINNETVGVGQPSAPWYWFASACKVPSLFDAAKAAGLTTAGVTWPVTGCNPAVDYLCAEYWPQRQDASMENAMLRSGSAPEVLSVIRPHCEKVDPYSKIHPSHPQYDVFTMGSACAMLRRFNPDFIAIHEAAVDAARHGSGVFSAAVARALDNVEAWTAELMQITKEMGTYEDTDFVLVSDHGQLDITRVIHLNVLLRREGLLQTSASGTLLGWQAFVRSAGMSAQVYLNNPEDQVLYNRVYALLCRLCEEGVYGISQVFTRSEIAEKEHLDGDFSFVVETDGYTSFGNEWDGALVRPMDSTDYKFGHATHGYLPDKGPQPLMLAFGPSYKEGVTAARRPLVDVAPTVACAMGVELPAAQGKCITEILR